MVREWFEGFEELQALSNSFAVMFKDNQGSMSFIASSAREKVPCHMALIRLMTLTDI